MFGKPIQCLVVAHFENKLKQKLLVEIKKRNSCRICDSKELMKILTLNQMPWTDQFLKQSDEKEFLYDINIFLCTNCETIQTQHDVNVDDYYENYQYAVGTSPFAKKFMKELVISIENLFFSSRKHLNVIEIGSGDGQQLVEFQKRGHNVLGIEPSELLVKKSVNANVKTIQKLFDEEIIPNIKKEMPRVDVVLMTYTFDHIPEPAKTLNALKKILTPNEGIFIFENHDFDKIIEQNEICLFEHEHSIYFNKKTAESALGYLGYKTLKTNWLPQEVVRANSLLVASTPVKNGDLKPSTNGIDLEFYRTVEQRLKNGIKSLNESIKLFKKKGLKIAGYGAGGRGVMTLATLESASEIDFLLDKNPKGNNIYTPKTKIRVVPLAHLESNVVDVIIVFSFGYMEEIKKDLLVYGYKPDQLVSMVQLMSGSYNKTIK